MTSLEDIGQRYYEHRQQIMLERQEGLTDTYNRMHNQQDRSPDIDELRRLHKEMDEAVLAAYGWSDIALDHGFHQTRQGPRYTISEAARREVLNRLLKLNHERYAEEQAAAEAERATEKATKAGSRKPRKGKSGQEERLL